MSSPPLLNPAELARAVREILSASAPSDTSNLVATHQGLAALAAEHTSWQETRGDQTDGISDFWSEISLLAPPPSLFAIGLADRTTVSPAVGRQDAIPFGLSISVSIKDLATHLQPLEFEWSTVPIASSSTALRFWPSLKQNQDGQLAKPSLSAGIEGDHIDDASTALHLVCDWHSYSLFVPTSACTLLSRRVASFESEAHASFAISLARTVAGALEQSGKTGKTTFNAAFSDVLPHRQVMTAFALRLAEALSELSSGTLPGTDAFGLVLSSTLLCPYAIALRRWDYKVPSLPAGITTFDSSRSHSDSTDREPTTSKESSHPSLWNRMRRVSTKGMRPPAIKQALTDRNVDSNVDCNVDSNVDVNNDGVATGLGSASNSQPLSRATQVGTGQAEAGDGTTINPNPTSTSTSNAGTGVGVAVGLQSAAAGVATHGPTFSVVQGCSDKSGSGTDGTASSTPTKSISNAHNTFNIGLGFSIKLPFRSDKSREERDRQVERDRAFALQLAAAKNATSSAAVAVAVPGSSASASTSAAAGENVTVIADSKAEGEKRQSQTVGDVKVKGVEAGPGTDSTATAGKLRAASPQKTHLGQGQVTHTFEDWESEDDAGGEGRKAEEDRMQPIDEEVGPGADPDHARGETHPSGTASAVKAAHSGAQERGVSKVRQPRRGMTTKTTVTTTTVTTIDRYPSLSIDLPSRDRVRDDPSQT